MYLVYFATLLALIVTTTATHQGDKCIGSKCSQGQKGKVPIRIVDGPTLGTNATKTCPDDQTLCEDDETCCATNMGGYGCCDPDHNRCCGDGVHCCPNNRVKPKVHRVSLKTSMNSAFAVGQFNYSTPNEVCPGARVQCPSGNTCCKNPDTDWACCPLLDAVCCDDGYHCCPSGYKCRLDLGQCVMVKKRRHFMPMTNKV